jgi:acetyl esterase
MPLDRHCARVLKLLEAADAPEDTPSPRERREALDELAQSAGGAPIPAAIIEHVIIANGHALRLRAYHPLEVDEAALQPMVYLHGGGGVAGSLDTHDNVCRALAVAGSLHVFSVEYRLAPEHPFPAALDDTLAAVRWVAAHTGGRLVLAGDSAGGALAAVAAAELCGRGEVEVARLLLICPIVDIGGDHASRTEFGDGYFISQAVVTADTADYLGQAGQVSDARISPLLADSFAHLPPTHVHVAEFDPFRDEGLAYAERLKASGVEVSVSIHPGMIHYFYAMPRLVPYARQALAAIGAELREAAR